MKYSVLFLKILPWLLVSILVSISVSIAWTLIDFEQQVCAREGTILVVAHNWAQGKSPYNPDTLPENLWVYGPAHPWIVKTIWGVDAKWSHIRMMNFCFLIVAATGLAWALSRNKVRCQYYILLPALALSAWLVSTSMTAYCDAGGLACFVWALALSQHGASWKSKLIACMLVLIGTLFKPYFLWAGPLISISIFCYENIKSAAKWTIIWAAFTATGVALFQINNPTFFNLTIQLHKDWATSYFTFLRDQTLAWSLRNTGTLVLVLIAISAFVLNRNYKIIKNWMADATTMQFLATVIILSGKLGWHGGAFLIYYLHLLTPVSLIWLGTRIDTGIYYNFKQIAIILNALALILYLPRPADDFGSFDPRLKEFLSKHHGSLAIPEMIPFADEYELIIPDNGQSEYLFNTNIAIQHRDYASEMKSAGKTWRKWRQYNWFTTVQNNIRSKKYPAIIISSVSYDLLPWMYWLPDIEKYYDQTLVIPMDYYMAEWNAPHHFGNQHELYFYIYVPKTDK
ncbi:MAG: hypothetical protein SFY80_08010 [Verrucomicrobiota bacterium]|nr:hypothetical protein [Verrucomicrobiota bacterium]